MRLFPANRPGDIPPKRSAAVSVAVVLSVIATSLTASALVMESSPAHAAPGSPGTPGTAPVIFTEDFENTSLQPVLLNTYTGSTGENYTADQAWLENCNGGILAFNSPDSASNSAGTQGCYGAAYSYERQLAYALGDVGGARDYQANHAVTAYTAGDPGANKVEFRTVQPIPIAGGGRFVSFSVDAAAVNCNFSSPLYNFGLVQSDGEEVPVGGTINVCASGRSINYPARGTNPAGSATGNRYTTSAGVKVTGDSLGVIMRNANGSGAGNDAAFDNIRILDTTPQLDKSFSPALQRTGGNSTLTFTVTNTSELGAKQGWGFTDNLPQGLVLANNTVGGTCNAQTSAPAGGSAIAVTNGNLAQNQRSCTITVQVTSKTAGTYNNCPTENVTTSYLNQPACASVEFGDPSYTVSKSADKESLKQGDKVTYTVLVKNTGKFPYTVDQPASFSDDLAKVTDDATYNSDASNGATVSGNTLSWSGALAVNETKTITYSFTVNTPDSGDHKLDNAVTPTGPGGTCDPNAKCVTSTPVQSFLVQKTADTDQVTPGSKITYTVTVKNTGQVAYTANDPASFTDDLSDVTDDATYNGDASNGATVSGNTLSWSGPLAVGATETITYSFTINSPDTGNKRLTNKVTPNDPTACQGQCTTTTPEKQYTVSKTSDVQSVKEGQRVTYTVTVTNTGVVDYTNAAPASFADDLSKVTDDATYNDDATGGATVDGDTLSWKGPLAQGASETITYSFTVNTPDTGDHLLTNAVKPTGPGGYCDPDKVCTTNTPVQSYTTSKSADKSSVQSGDTITYTVTVTNTGQVDYTTQDPAEISDNLSGVTDDATYVAGSATNGAQVNGDSLTWSGPLAKGATTTITYKFTVNTPDNGDKVLKNAVSTPPGSGGSCDTSEGRACTTNTPVTSYEITKSVDKMTAINGDTVTWTISVKNTGTGPVSAKFSDSLKDVVDDATYNNDQKASSGTVGYQDGSVVWSGTVPVGQTATITYSATVNSPDTGNHDLGNAVTPINPPPGTPPVPPTHTLVKEFTVTKTASEQAANPGDTVKYTLTVANTGKVAYTDQDPAALTDDLSNVIDDATWNGDQVATAGEVSYQQPKLNWSGPIPVGDAVTITYSVKVNTPDTGDRNLQNTVASAGCFGSCETNTPVRSFTVAKQADKVQAKPGQTVTYTVTVTNTGKADYTSQNPASFTDDMSKVIDDATYNGDARATAGSTAWTSPKLTWTGPVAAGKTVTITYSVTVNNPDTGDKQLDNVVVPGSPGGSCSTVGSCVTHTTVVVTPPPAGPIVETGGTVAGPAWPFIGGGIAALGVLATLTLMGVMRRRREDGDSV